MAKKPGPAPGQVLIRQQEMNDQLNEITAQQYQLLEIFGINAAIFNRLVREKVLPEPVAFGKYPFALTVKLYCAYLKRRTGPANSASIELAAQRARLTTAKADVAMLEKSKLFGELLPYNQIRDAWISLVTTARARLLAIPSKMASRILTCRTPLEAQFMLRDEIFDAIEQLGRLDAATLVSVDASEFERFDRDSSAALDASAETDDIEVG